MGQTLFIIDPSRVVDDRRLMTINSCRNGRIRLADPPSDRVYDDEPWSWRAGLKIDHLYFAGHSVQALHVNGIIRVFLRSCDCQGVGKCSLELKAPRQCGQKGTPCENQDRRLSNATESPFPSASQGDWSVANVPNVVSELAEGGTCSACGGPRGGDTRISGSVSPNE